MSKLFLICDRPRWTCQSGNRSCVICRDYSIRRPGFLTFSSIADSVFGIDIKDDDNHNRVFVEIWDNYRCCPRDRRNVLYSMYCLVPTSGSEFFCQRYRISRNEKDKQQNVILSDGKSEIWFKFLCCTEDDKINNFYLPES